MTITELDKKKLRAIGYDLGPHEPNEDGSFDTEATFNGERITSPTVHGAIDDAEEAAWDACKAHAQGDGLKATAMDKIAWLMAQGYAVQFENANIADGIFVDLCSIRKSEFHTWQSCDKATVLESLDALFWQVGT